MLREQQFNPPSRLAILLVLVGAGIIVSSILTGILAKILLDVPLENLAQAMLQPENISFSRLLQVFTSFLMMGVPALVLSKITGGDAIKDLGFNDQINIKQVGIVVLMVVTGFFLSGALSELNRMIPLSAKATELFERFEDRYNQTVMAIGNMKTVSDFIVSLIVMALVPSIFEEMLFRGSLQQVMVSLTRNPVTGILLTSLLFSAIHISFYGFLPRLFLGLMLGYIFYESKNLWLSVIAHFINNAYTLVVMFSLSRQGKLSTEAFEETYPLYFGLIALAALVFLFILLRKETQQVHAASPDNTLPHE